MAHLDELLDEALKETFPASDPVAINVEQPEHETATTLGTGGASKALRSAEGVKM